MEFKYFLNYASERMIAIDFVVGEDTFIRSDTIKSAAQLPKVDEKKFFDSLNLFGKPVFQQLFDFAKTNGLLIRWGSKGFSINITINDGFVGLCFGYPPQSVFRQSIYTGFEEIRKKVNNSDSIIELYRTELEKTNKFISAKSNLKWIIDKPMDNSDIENFLTILNLVINKIQENGLK
jgi:hypothetical protein